MKGRIVIIGNGISGITAARYCRKASDRPITIVSSETSKFIARTALMYAYMGSIRDCDLKPYEDESWNRNRFELRQDYAIQVDTEKKEVNLVSGEAISYDQLVLACGGKPRRLGWPGEYLPGVQGLYSMQDLELMRRNTDGIRRAAVVGGGLIGVEVAEMLRSRGIEVVFVVREKSYMDYVLPDEESQMIARHIRKHAVDLQLGVELESIRTGPDGRVGAIDTSDGNSYDVEFVALAVGVSPNTDLALRSAIDVRSGVVVNRFFETSAKDVYAIGDCAEFSESLPSGEVIQQLWYTGREHGKILANTLLGNRAKYEPGVYFNSAKFFGIEYQTYGRISAVPASGVETVAVVDEVRERVIRIDYESGSHAVLGFNLLGVRYRQNVCARWIRERTSIETVLEHLDAVNFDPEFSSSIEDQLRALYYARTPETITI